MNPLDRETEGDLEDLRRPARQWRGVIEEYRPLLDLIPDDLEPVTLREGGTPLVHSDWLSERGRRRRVAEGRGRQPDRLVQGPRHDRGDLGRLPRGRPGRGLRVDRQHLGVDVGVRREGRHHPDRADARGQDRRREDGPGDRARRADRDGAGQLRPLPRSWPASCRGATRSPWSTRSTRSGCRARRPRRSRSSTSSATPPTSTCCPSATPATSRRTGWATSSTPRSAARPASRGCAASRPRAPRRW